MRNMRGNRIWLPVLMVFLASGCDDSSSSSPTDPSNPMGSVTIYERDNFGGGSLQLEGDVFDLSDLPGPCNVGNNWEDCISSIEVTGGWTAILYEGDGFDGDSLPILFSTGNLDNISGCGLGDWDNCASSIQVHPN